MDIKNLRIMEILAHNCRISDAAVSDSVHLSKDAVNSRIRKLESEKYILDYLLFIDSRRLGYTRYQLLLQLNSEIHDKEIIYKKLKDLPFVIWINTFLGRYDLQIIVDAKDEFHLNELRQKIFHICSNKVRDHKILICLSEFEFTNLNPEIEQKTKFKKKNDYSFSLLAGKSNFAGGREYKLSKINYLDVELLKLLSDNPKVSLVELSNKLKIDRKTVRKKIIKLIQEVVISSFATIINPTKFGYVTYALYARIIQNTSDEVLKKPLEKLKNIFFAARMMGDYDFIFYLYAKSPEELNKTLEEFKKGIGNNLVFFDLFIQDKVLFWKHYTEGMHQDLKEKVQKI